MDTVSASNAGFWIRVLAYVLDSILLTVAGAILQGLFGPGFGGGLSLLASVGYFAYFWTTTGQTLGHKALNLRVIRTDGTNLNISGAIIRYIGYILSAIPLGLGFMWVGWDAQKQGWHDKLARTYVIRV